MTPQEFVAKWRNDTSTERQSYQQHFLDLCALVGHHTPAELDRDHNFFTFEYGATKQDGGNGFADVWFKGHFAVEYKRPDGNLKKAYDQLLQYRESLENPPLLIVGTTQILTIHTNFTGTAKQVIDVTLDDILTPLGMQRIRNIFYNPEAFRPEKTAAQVTEEAAAKFGALASHLAKWGHSPHDVAHYLIRLLFCLFSEDIDLLPKDLFTRMVDAGKRDNARFNRQVRLLFSAMAEGKDFGLDQIKYFDGGLFDDDTSLDLDSDGIDILQGITQLDWSAIEPAILGTLFTRSLDPSKRSQLGAHYTSKDDILLIVEPVLMAPLRREWTEVKANATELALRRQAAQSRAVATRIQNELSSLILGFAQKLATVRVLDPACGSGNFLYVALRLLLELWKEVSIFAGEVGLSQISPLPSLSPSPEQLYGIEVNDYAHELAQATVWIGYLQWLHENGYGFLSEPILKPLDNIKHMDAILAYDADGKPVEPEWPAADVIVGNPPFLGGNRIRKELGTRYVDSLFELYDGRVPAFADLVCYWFEAARSRIVQQGARRAGLLATNSIRGGANRQVIQRILDTADIFGAWSDRPWILDDAAVRVSIIGFDDGTEYRVTNTRLLDGVSVDHIDAGLDTGQLLIAANQLSENLRICYQGASAKGPFDIDEFTATRFLMAPENRNGRSNSEVVRQVAGAMELVRSRGYNWTIDFGLLPEEEAMQYELPYEYLKEHVYPIRSANRRASYAQKWWQYAEPRPGMRRALSNLPRFISTPAHSKYRLFVWMPKDVLCNQATLVFARSDDYFFGVLHAKPHELWSLRMGTSLEDRPRYTPTTTFETYPFPWPPGKEPTDDPRVKAIAGAAKELVELRDAWLNPPGLTEKELAKRTLTNLYNERPDWLDVAHIRLDAAVFAAYGWPHDLSDEEILARLLTLNLERAGKHSESQPNSKFGAQR